MERQEYYMLKNLKTNLYFGGFSKEVRNKPIWVSEPTEAKVFKEMEALRMQRRLECQYLPYQKIVMEEK